MCDLTSMSRSPVNPGYTNPECLNPEKIQGDQDAGQDLSLQRLQPGVHLHRR